MKTTPHNEPLAVRICIGSYGVRHFRALMIVHTRKQLAELKRFYWPTTSITNNKGKHYAISGAT